MSEKYEELKQKALACGFSHVGARMRYTGSVQQADTQVFKRADRTDNRGVGGQL